MATKRSDIKNWITTLEEIKQAGHLPKETTGKIKSAINQLNNLLKKHNGSTIKIDPKQLAFCQRIISNYRLCQKIVN